MLLHSHGFPSSAMAATGSTTPCLASLSRYRKTSSKQTPLEPWASPTWRGRNNYRVSGKKWGLAVSTSKRIPQTFDFFLTSSWATWAAFWSASLSWKKKRKRGGKKEQKSNILIYSYSLTYWARQVDAHKNTIPSAPNILSYLNTYLTTQHQTVISASQLSFALICLQGHTTKHCPPFCPPSQRWTLACHTSGLTTLTSDHL